VHTVNVKAELQTANVAYFQRKIQLSGFSLNLEDWAGQPLKKNYEWQLKLHTNYTATF
jgi:hypothetical protein